MLQRQIPESRPEERFIELFQDVFGPVAAAKLDAQVHFRDILGRDRYIDFGLDSLLERYALEIDGETYHHPAALTSADYADQLVRQNSLVHQGWRVLRWTDHQIADRPEEVREHLAILLDQAVRLTVPAEYLPSKRGSLIDLHEHQAQALEQIEALRADGQQIALLAHAVGTGKTTTAVEDARRVGARTLFLAHTEELVQQALARFGELWPEATRARLGEGGDEMAKVVVGTVQYMSGNLARFAPRDWGYVVIDEAHHATSRTYRAVLRYFDPAFLLGLTGTPERADGQNALDVFRNTAHRMDLRTAVESGILCDVRCFRVETNVDLSRLRFNGNLYNQRDLEVSVSVPERDRLILETYAENVPGRAAVVFCVSVAHAESMAQRFSVAGFAAKAVSGKLSKLERERTLAQFDNGAIRVLCACDVLNEGWDAPHIEVLLMARPTLSKVIYQQQIGRGMRAHPGKASLVLFDFVDAFGRHNEAMSAHKLTRKPTYRAGERLFGPAQDGDATDLPLNLWATDYVPVNIFDWQEQIEGMVTAPALSALLRKDSQWVTGRWRSGEIVADAVIDLGGERSIPYFRAKRVPELREQYGFAEVTDANLFDALRAYLDDAAMTRSYKPVWFLAVLACADAHGRASASEVTEAFWQFYRDRVASGQVAEQSGSALQNPDVCSLYEVREIINRGPFHRFSRLGYVVYDRDAAYYRIAAPVWQRIAGDAAVRAQVEGLCRESIERYYQRASHS